MPDPFAAGRGVLVTVHEQGTSFIGEQNSLTTKCPSKYQAASLVLMRDGVDAEMALVGRALLILGLLVALYGIGASLYGARSGRPEWVRLGAPRGVRAGRADDVRVRDPRGRVPALGLLVQRRRRRLSTTTPTFYKLAAAWSSQQGSLLLWVFLLSLWSSLILFLTRKRVREIAPYATAVLLGFGAFFISLTVFFANPFATTREPAGCRAPASTRCCCTRA